MNKAKKELNNLSQPITRLNKKKIASNLNKLQFNF